MLRIRDACRCPSLELLEKWVCRWEGRRSGRAADAARDEKVEREKDESESGQWKLAPRFLLIV